MATVPAPTRRPVAQHVMTRLAAALQAAARIANGSHPAAFGVRSSPLEPPALRSRRVERDQTLLPQDPERTRDGVASNANPSLGSRASAAAIVPPWTSTATLLPCLKSRPRDRSEPPSESWRRRAQDASDASWKAVAGIAAALFGERLKSGITSPVRSPGARWRRAGGDDFEIVSRDPAVADGPQHEVDAPCRVRRPNERQRFEAGGPFSRAELISYIVNQDVKTVGGVVATGRS